MKKVKGWKCFNIDMTCKGFQFEVGKTYEQEGKITLCEKGFHFHEHAIDIFKYYSTNKKETAVCEVMALGEVIKGNNKSVTNKIKIIKKLSCNEIDKITLFNGNSGYHNSGYHNSGHRNSGEYNSGHRNSGDYNSGYRNSGDYNSGDYNSGEYNSGYRNSGDYNSGNYNSGEYNSGYRNSGDYNSGYRNSGDYNSGDYNSGYHNSGDYNSGDLNSGFFNSTQQNVRMFNKDTNMKYEQVRLPSWIHKLQVTENISWSDMTEEEKKINNCYCCGGYMKSIPYKQAWKNLWKSINNEERKQIEQLPNFDFKVFEEITGIKI